MLKIFASPKVVKPENIKPILEMSTKKDLQIQTLEEYLGSRKKRGLEELSKEEAEIKTQERLSQIRGIGVMVAKDAGLRFEINKVGQGWYWDFEANIISCDVLDLIEKPLEYSLFVVQHEGAHRRISRIAGVVDEKLWQNKIYNELTQKLEDWAVNTYAFRNVAGTFDELLFTYSLDEGKEQKRKEKLKDKINVIPKYSQAIMEINKQGFANAKNEKREIPKDLPEDVKNVLTEILPLFKKYYESIPTLEELKTGVTLKSGTIMKGEELVVAWAKKRYEICSQNIWPLLQKLIDKDVEELKQKIQNGEVDPNKIGDGDGEKSDKSEEKTGEKIGDKGSPLDISKMSEQELKELAEKILQDLQGEMSKDGKSESQNIGKPSSGKKTEKKDGDKGEVGEGEVSEEIGGEDPADLEGKTGKEIKPKISLAEIKERLAKEKLEEQKISENSFRQRMRDRGLYKLAKKLEDFLEEEFYKRRESAKRVGLKTGSNLNVGRIIQNEAREESGQVARYDDLYEARKKPEQKDYCIEILVDLSGSCRDKIEEMLDVAVTAAKVLSGTFGIKLSVTGFNDKRVGLYRYLKYGEKFTDEVGQRMLSMVREVTTYFDVNIEGDARAQYNDDGWAVDEVSKVLGIQVESEKILMIISDGIPVPSPGAGNQGKILGEVVGKIQREKVIKLVVSGVGDNTEGLKDFYPDSVNTSTEFNIRVQYFPEVFQDQIRKVFQS